MQQIALLIGVNRYLHPACWSSLSGSCNDVILMNHALVEFLAFSHENISFLTDASEVPPTRDRILAQLDALAARTTKGDVVLLFYSGHGNQHTNDNVVSSHPRIECIVPCDSGLPPRYDRSIYDFEINKKLQSIAAKSPAFIVTIFDCCHSGHVIRGPHTRGIGSDPLPIESGVVPLDRRLVSLCGSTADGDTLEDAISEADSDVVDILQRNGGTPNDKGKWKCGLWTLSIFRALQEAHSNGDTHRISYYDLWKASIERLHADQTPTFHGYGSPSLANGVTFHPIPEILRVGKVYIQEGGLTSKISVNAGCLYGIRVNSEYYVALDDEEDSDQRQEFVVTLVSFHTSELLIKDRAVLDRAIVREGAVLWQSYQAISSSTVVVSLKVDEKVLADNGYQLSYLEHAIRSAGCTIHAGDPPTATSLPLSASTRELIIMSVLPGEQYNGPAATKLSVTEPSLVVLDEDGISEGDAALPLGERRCFEELQSKLSSVVGYHRIRAYRQHPERGNALENMIEMKMHYGTQVEKCHLGGERRTAAIAPAVRCGSVIEVEIISHADFSIYYCLLDLQECHDVVTLLPLSQYSTNDQISTDAIGPHRVQREMLGSLESDSRFPRTEIFKLFASRTPFKVRPRLVDGFREVDKVARGGSNESGLSSVLSAGSTLISTARGVAHEGHWISREIEFINVPA